MTFLRQWLLRLIACAFLTGFAEHLSGEGAMRRLTRFCGGLIMILCLLHFPSDAGGPAWDVSAYRSARESAEAAYAAQREAALREGIAQRTGAYIEDKAAEMGLAVTAAVRVERREDGLFVPKAAELCGERSAELAEWIERELGIPCSRQEWREAK